MVPSSFLFRQAQHGMTLRATQVKDPLEKLFKHFDGKQKHCVLSDFISVLWWWNALIKHLNLICSEDSEKYVHLKKPIDVVEIKSAQPEHCKSINFFQVLSCLIMRHSKYKTYKAMLAPFVLLLPRNILEETRISPDRNTDLTIIQNRW